MNGDRCILLAKQPMRLTSTWEDYLSMAKQLHMDVYDEIVYRTRKLRRRHDDLVFKCQEKDIELQAEEMEEKFPHVDAICQEIKAKYEYADADYMVMVPGKHSGHYYRGASAPSLCRAAVTATGTGLSVEKAL